MNQHPKTEVFAAAVAVVALVAGAIYLVDQAFDDQKQALEAVERQSLDVRQAATRRIDTLNETILRLEERVVGLNRQVDALEAQVREMGGEPVVVERTVVQEVPSRQAPEPEQPQRPAREAPPADSADEPPPPTDPAPTAGTETTEPRQRGRGEKKGHNP